VDPGTPEALPWWAQTRARLALLLLILLAGGGGTLLAASALRSASADDGCWIHEGPPSIWLRPAVVSAAVQRLGLRSVAGRGTVTESGLSPSDAAWTDAPPGRFMTRRAFVPAGYEVRWRGASGDRLGVAAYRFADPSAAADFVAAASSTRCRPGATDHPVVAPPSATVLTHTGPRGAPQLDLFFRRGPTGYRLFDVPAGGRAGEGRGTGALAALACRLTEARCAGQSGGG
jgi:hypothetical protein